MVLTDMKKDIDLKYEEPKEISSFSDTIDERIKNTDKEANEKAIELYNIIDNKIKENEIKWESKILDKEKSEKDIKIVEDAEEELRKLELLKKEKEKILNDLKEKNLILAKKLSEKEENFQIEDPKNLRSQILQILFLLAANAFIIYLFLNL